ALAVLRDSLLPGFGGLVVLPAVLEDPCQQGTGVFAGRALAAPGDALVNLDPVELIRQLEALHAGCQAGDRLVFAESVDGENARFLLLVLVARERPAVRRQRLHVELLPEEVREQHVYLVADFRVELHRLRQHPAPALAVALGVWITLRRVVENRV